MDQQNNGVPPAVTPAQPANQMQDSTRMSLLARREKALQDRIREMETADTGYKSKLSEYEKNYINRDRLKSDPLTVLSELGIDYDSLSQRALSQSRPDEPQIKSLQDKIDKLLKAQEDSHRNQEEQKSSQYKQALTQIEYDASQLVNANPDYELIKHMGKEGIGEVVALIEDTYKSSGRLMTVDEASKEVEAYFTEKISAMAKLGKISKLTQVPPVEAPRTAPVTTLSGKMTSNNNPEKDRIARAIAAYKGQQA